MSAKTKLLFDENFGKPVIEKLAALAQSETVEIKHIFDFYGSGTHDEVWIPQVASGDWILVSADRGKRAGGEKLPRLCREKKVTHVLLSAKVHQMRQFDKMRAILSVWPELLAVSTQPKGSRYSLRKTPHNTVKLVPVDKPKDLI